MQKKTITQMIKELQELKKKCHVGHHADIEKTITQYLDQEQAALDHEYFLVKKLFKQEVK